jgi:hypothetical protein
VETAGEDAMKTTTKACVLFCTATIQNFIPEKGEASSVFLHLSPQTGMTTHKKQKTSLFQMLLPLKAYAKSYS